MTPARKRAILRNPYALPLRLTHVQLHGTDLRTTIFYWSQIASGGATEEPLLDRPMSKNSVAKRLPHIALAVTFSAAAVVLFKRPAGETMEPAVPALVEPSLAQPWPERCSCGRSSATALPAK